MILIAADSLCAVLDEVALEVLDEAHVPFPPVDALWLARRLQIDVAFDAGQVSRGRLKRLGGRAAIFLRPDKRPERMQFSAAHEIGETLVRRICERAGWEPEMVRGRLRENIANALASRLLLPSCTFLEDAGELRGDLIRLKQIYRTASHELIACRLLDLPEPTIITVFDHGRMTRRQSNFGDRPPPPARIERDVRGESHRTSAPAEMYDHGWTVQGWPVHEPAWKREILRTVIDELDE